MSRHAFHPVFFNETHDRATLPSRSTVGRPLALALHRSCGSGSSTPRNAAASTSFLARSEMQLPSTERDAKVSTSHFFYPVLPAESRGSLSHVAPLGKANRGSSCTPLWAQPGQALADGSLPFISRTQATYSSKRLGHGSSSAYPAKFTSTWREGDGEQRKRQPARPTHTENERRHARRQGIASVLAQGSLPLKRRELPFTVLSS